MILVITSWFPNNYEPTKCIFTKNILDAQARYSKYEYKLISPIPFFPKIKLPFIKGKFKNYSLLKFSEDNYNYKTYRPRFFKLPHPLTSNIEWYGYLRSVLRVINYENLNFELVHSHGLYPDSYVAVKIAEKFKIPSVVHVHDSYLYELCERYKSQIDFIMNLSHKIIAVSDFQKDILINKYPEHSDKIITVYNGINTERFKIINYDVVGNVKLIFVGNLIKVKGVDILLRALNILKTTFKITLDIYGDGSNRIKYQDMAVQLGLSDFVNFKGIVSNDELTAVLNRYSFLVLPSRYETFGIVLIEAMACGIPVIATKVGAVPEVVSDERVGILVEPNSPEAFAEGIKKAIKTNWNRGKIWKYAQRFSIENSSTKLESIYDEILA